VSALDTHYQSMVAIKVVRKEDDAVQSAMEEIRQLEMLRPYYPEQHHCLRLLCAFWFEDHFCLVFPLLGKSVHDYMAMVNNDVFCCFTLDEVRHIGFQMCSAMNCKFEFELFLFYFFIQSFFLSLPSQSSTVSVLYMPISSRRISFSSTPPTPKFVRE